MPTFLFTDIEGSTTRWELFRSAMSAALARHDAILQEAVALCGGRVVKHTGDGMIAVFDNGQALECAVKAQKALNDADWSEVEDLRVRMCVFAGEAEERDGDFFGPALNGAARMLSAAWGGQVLVNDSAAACESLPEGASLIDAGVHVLRDLMEPQQIYVLAHSTLPAEFPALRTLSSHPQNLPVQPTPFLGRARELDEVCGLLSKPDCRLLTLLAPGGTGKSRLALQAAARMITGFRHGAFFVKLEDVPSAAMIPAAIASTMSLRFSGPAPEEEQLASFLADREVLIIADNFEHLSNESPVLSRLLAKAPGLKLVVTSRHRLNLREEQVYELHGMNLPALDGTDLEECDASSLFLSSADRADPGYQPGKSDRRAIASICAILDGSPLGIELASSWVRMVSPADIEKELRRNFELLDSAPLDMPGRHRGLEAVFEYSWSLLDDRERDALSGLSVFAGQFEPDAASEVAGCGLPILRRLVDKSLIQCPERGWFAMHPIVHAYAAGKLAREPARLEDLRERHARHFAAKMREVTPELSQGSSAEALRKVEAALPNLVPAWDHAAERWSASDARVFFVAMSHLFIVRCTLTTGWQIFEGKLRQYRERWGAQPEPAQAALMSGLLERMATFRNLSGSLDESRPLLAEALELAARSNDPELEPRILGTLGVLEARLANHPEAKDYFHRMLAKLEETGNVTQLSVALTNLATLEFMEGNTAGAIEYYERSLANSRRLGDVIAQMRTLGTMGFILMKVGDGDKAYECISASLEIARQVGDRRAENMALLGMADLLIGTESERAVEFAEESLRLAEAIEHLSMQGHSLMVLAHAQAARGRTVEAREAIDRALAILGSDLDSQAEEKYEVIMKLIAAQEEASKHHGETGQGV